MGVPIGLSDLTSLRRPTPGDGDGHGDGEGDGDGDRDRNLLSLSKPRLVRLGAGVANADCWGVCSPADCCTLARFDPEVEPEVSGGENSERFFDFDQEAMLEFFLYCCNWCI